MIVKKKSSVDSKFKHPQRLLVRRGVFEDKVLQWSAHHCDCCQEEVLCSVVGDQLESKWGWSDRKPGQVSSYQEEASRRFEEKSEGRNCATQCPSGQPQQDS